MAALAPSSSARRVPTSLVAVPSLLSSPSIRLASVASVCSIPTRLGERGGVGRGGAGGDGADTAFERLQFGFDGGEVDRLLRGRDRGEEVVEGLAQFGDGGVHLHQRRIEADLRRARRLLDRRQPRLKIGGPVGKRGQGLGRIGIGGCCWGKAIQLAAR